MRLANGSTLATCGVLLCLFVWLVAFVVKGIGVDNRCFFGVLVLGGDRRGRDVILICCDWFWMKRFCLKVRIDVVFMKG